MDPWFRLRKESINELTGNGAVRHCCARASDYVRSHGAKQRLATFCGGSLIDDYRTPRICRLDVCVPHVAALYSADFDHS